MIDKCWHCSDSDVSPVSVPQFSLDNHDAVEVSMLCFKCKRQYVAVYTLQGGLLESTRFPQ